MKPVTLDEARTALRAYREQGGTWPALVAARGALGYSYSTASLSRLAAEKQGTGKRGVSRTLLRELPIALASLGHEPAPPGRRSGRPLRGDLDTQALEIQYDRDPYWRFVQAASRLAEERSWMSRPTYETEYRGLDTLYQAWGNRDETGRPTRTSYPLSFYETADGDGDQATRNRRLVQRRVKRGLVRDVDSPLSRLFESLFPVRAMPIVPAELGDARPPCAPAQQALECLCAEITRAARWARTVEISTAQAPVWADHRRRREVLHAPGAWSPERLQAAGVSCSCKACRRTWPTADAWWHEHNSATQ
jgi:hypothetical protein